MSCKNCIENYILLKAACGSEESISCRYVENLEGMSIENIASIAPEKLASAKKFVAEKLKFAFSIVQNRLVGILQELGLRLNTIGKLYEACRVTTDSYGPDAWDKGILVDKMWLGSDMSAIWVETVKIKALSTGTSTIKIKAIDGTVLYSKTVGLVAGLEVKTAIQQYFYKDRILITVDTTNQGVYLYKCDHSTECKPCQSKSQYFHIRGWNGSGISEDGFLGACIRLDCTDKDLLCKFLGRDGISLALLYQLGAEIAKEWTSPSNRLNIIKDNGSEWAATKAKDWEALSIEALDNEIKSIIGIIKADKFCYNCQDIFKSIPMLP